MEVWAYGLRNPWRFSFDGDLLYIGDVGQRLWEEIDVAPVAAAGINYGWPIMEGQVCFDSDSCDQDGLFTPVVAYSHDEGCSVTGGYVYRGSAIPELDGHYFYADWCGGWIRSFRYDDGRRRCDRLGRRVRRAEPDRLVRAGRLRRDLRRAAGRRDLQDRGGALAEPPGGYRQSAGAGSDQAHAGRTVDGPSDR